MIRRATESILVPMSDPIFAQACLTPAWVALVFAKLSSIQILLIMRVGTKPKRLLKKCWSAGSIFSSKEASFAFDEQMHTYLVDSADTRGAQRLHTLLGPRKLPNCSLIVHVLENETSIDKLGDMLRLFPVFQFQREFPFPETICSRRRVGQLSSRNPNGCDPRSYPTLGG